CTPRAVALRTVADSLRVIALCLRRAYDSARAGVASVARCLGIYHRQRVPCSWRSDTLRHLCPPGSHALNAATGLVHTCCVGPYGCGGTYKCRPLCCVASQLCIF